MGRLRFRFGGQGADQHLLLFIAGIHMVVFAFVADQNLFRIPVAAVIVSMLRQRTGKRPFHRAEAAVPMAMLLLIAGQISLGIPAFVRMGMFCSRAGQLSAGGGIAGIPVGMLPGCTGQVPLHGIAAIGMGVGFGAANADLLQPVAALLMDMGGLSRQGFPFFHTADKHLFIALLGMGVLLGTAEGIRRSGNTGLAQPPAHTAAHESCKSQECGSVPLGALAPCTVAPHFFTGNIPHVLTPNRKILWYASARAKPLKRLCRPTVLFPRSR